ncbi:MAG: hypothetical protein AB4290_11705 [Spirulina sp.]
MPNLTLIRGCGERKAGGIYLEFHLSLYGQPLEYFLIDPPILTKLFDVPKLGQKLINRNGQNHIADIVGSRHYPNVLDFYYEVENWGLSRRVSPLLEFEKLNRQSRILVAHDRAFVQNWQKYPDFSCPKKLPLHQRDRLLQEPNTEQNMCAGVWWRDIEEITVNPEVTSTDAVLGGQSFVPKGAMVLGGREGLNRETKLLKTVREMPSFTYEAWKRPLYIKPQYRQAFFLSLPISNIAIISGSDSEHNRRLAEQANLPIVMKTS